MFEKQISKESKRANQVLRKLIPIANSKLKNLRRIVPNKNDRIALLIVMLDKEASEVGLTDPFNYNRGREWLLAHVLGHNWSPTYRGPDAFEKNGNPLEYKATINSPLSVRYAGISNMSTWSKQMKLIREKICGCPRHFYGRWKDGVLVEIQTMEGFHVLKCLVSSIKTSWTNRMSNKDGRTAGALTSKNITKYGTRIL